MRGLSQKRNKNQKRRALLARHASLCAAARRLMARKNHDYAHEDDPFRNFRTFGAFGVLVRLHDKIARLRSFEESGKQAVKDEKILDTVLDIINYAAIYHEMKEAE